MDTLYVSARLQLSTGRLVLCAPSIELAAETLAFYERNRTHLAPWEPARDPRFFTLTAQRAALAVAVGNFEAQSAIRYWMRTREDPTQLVGHVSLSQIARGVSQSAMLGYALEGACEGRGLMTEALGAVLAEVFSDRVGLHRVQANVRIENARSVRVLERLGFAHEGLARRYLFIDGAWRDHTMHALLNPVERAVICV
ncbi:MAG: GNAT family N-acetyltransferase [Deltaproteobacteria bacterium]|nr:GNAT family N-acetyltransferase [Deltaproteobacteria bacterium]